MLKVLLLYYEPAPSGQTTHVLALARSLHNHGHQVTVALPAHLVHSVTAFRQLGVDVAPLPLGKVAWPPQSVVALIRLIRSGRPDVVHVHSQEAGIPGRILAWLARAPRIFYTPQTIDIRRARWRRAYVLIERALAHLTDVVISVNDTDRGRLARWGIAPEKLVTIHNGIDLGAFAGPIDAEALRRSLGLDADRPLVMQLARLSAQKDPLAFVEGAARVAQERPDAQFALIGDGPLRKAVESCVQALGLEERVHLLGWRDRGYRLLAAADVVTLTSQWEGTPYSLLEAMAWSRPVVATAVNGCTEVVTDGDTGFLTPPGDITTWVRQVLELLNDPALNAQMGKQGRRQVEQRFSLEETVARTESLYQQMSPLL